MPCLKNRQIFKSGTCKLLHVFFIKLLEKQMIGTEKSLGAVLIDVIFLF